MIIPERQQESDLVATTNNHHQEIEDDPNFDRKLDLITAGAQPFVKKHLLERITRENTAIIVSYIVDFLTEVSPRQAYRIETILRLKELAEFHDPSPPKWQKRHYPQYAELKAKELAKSHKPKSFRDMTRQDIIDFLDR